MRALRSFTVRPQLPDELAALGRLALNLRWSWDTETQELFSLVDADCWERTGHDPVHLLGAVPPDRLHALARDEAFTASLAEADAALSSYLGEPRWFQGQGGSPLRQVAYFSPEFGIAESLPQYSGGLGVLAGDHLKAASDLGVPLVGLGLFYRHGYFRQALDTGGWQLEIYPDLDPFGMALTCCEGVRVEVDLAGRTLAAQVWRADVGRIPLYLLDADIDDNPPELRTVTDRLYGGDVEHRLCQEILLGVGGVRALEALGIDADVFHTNEGHAGFLGLERIRLAMAGGNMTLPEAVEAVRAGCIFTTHTPVPAGIDRFPRELMDRYFAGWAAECGVTIDDLMALGHRPGDAAEERFNMAVMGLRLAGRSNAVSKLHGAVSRDMFADLWADLEADEVPITSVTNGVHPRTWVSPEIDDLLTRTIAPAWDEAGSEEWARVTDVADDELWSVMEQGRQRLVHFVRDRLQDGAGSRGGAGSQVGAVPSAQTTGMSSDTAWGANALDPGALTICFARRFATYKRAALLLSQPDRLRALLLSADRPVQFVFAGKAHPADEAGKAMIRQIATQAADADVRHRFVFLSDYDIAVARVLYQGADVWLNNPRRPQEACGTSGMKAALNGSLNCSILDGWWDELFDGENGWAIASAEGIEDLERRDEVEADALFDLLEHHVVPLFYDRADGSTPPPNWLSRVKHALATLGPAVVAPRMVRDYVTELYEPTAARAAALGAGAGKRARELAAWKSQVVAMWGGVEVVDVDVDTDVAGLGTERQAAVAVRLGDLSADDVEVQLVHGPVGQDDELDQPSIVPMSVNDQPGADVGRDIVHYVGSFHCDHAGRYGCTIRVVPTHPDLASPLELGCIARA